jgi:uncharacterized protein YjiS (DUF1127 family)
MAVQILQELALAGRSAGDAALPEIHMSALSVCLDTVRTWMARADQKRALRDPAEEARLLSDMGTRQQALREAGKPFWRR